MFVEESVVVGEDDVACTMYFLRGHVYRIRPKRINSTGLGAGMTLVGLY